MLSNKKPLYLPSSLTLYLFFFICVNLHAQGRTNSISLNPIVSEERSAPQQEIQSHNQQFSSLTSQGDPKAINDYKFVTVESSGLNDDPYWLRNGKEVLLNKIWNKLSGYGVPILKYANGARKCDVLYCYYGKSLNSEINKDCYKADIYFLDCHDNVVLYLPSKSSRPNIDMLSKEFMKLAQKGADVFYEAYMETMFQDFGDYHYSYNAPAEVVKSNPIITQTVQAQSNSSNTNHLKTETPKTITVAPVVSDIDINIPTGTKPNSNRFALIIGNEDYHSNQTGLRAEADVEYAAHDATTFKEYAIKVLGVPEDNLIFITNARLVEMSRSIDKLSLLSKATGGDGEIFFYYAGHGFPDEKTKEAYIIPVDVSASDLKYALKLKDIYMSLTAYQSKRVTIFLDACFSGGAREEGLLASRGVKIKPKETVLNGNEVVFCATSNDQSALAYKTKGHGMFTYFLLKKLQETKGDIAYGELHEYIQKQVGVKSILENSKEQTPTVVVSPTVTETWKTWRMK